MPFEVGFNRCEITELTNVPSYSQIYEGPLIYLSVLIRERYRRELAFELLIVEMLYSLRSYPLEF